MSDRRDITLVINGASVQGGAEGVGWAGRRTPGSFGRESHGKPRGRLVLLGLGHDADIAPEDRYQRHDEDRELVAQDDAQSEGFFWCGLDLHER